MNNGIAKKLRLLSYKDLIILLIPFIIFIGYLYVYNPGIARLDSFTHLHQIATGHFNTWHPFFYTFIEMMCLKIYPNTKGIAILQISVFCIIWMVICNYFRNENSKNKIDKEFIFQVIFTLMICLIPFNPISSITFLKDTLFSYFLLFICFLIKVLLDKKGDVSLFFIVIFSLTLAFAAQLRPNGTILILILLVLLFVYLWHSHKNKKLPISIISLTVLFIVLILSLNIVYDVENNDKDAVSAKIMHMLVDYELNLDMDSADKSLISEVIINDTKSKQDYVLESSDLIYKLTNHTSYDDNKLEIIGMAIKYSIKNPYHFLQYIFHSSPMVWHIAQQDEWGGHAYATNTDYSRERFYRANTPPLENYDNITPKNSETKWYKDIDSFVMGFATDNLKDTLFNNPAFYMYLSFILIGAIYLLTKSKDIFLMYLPNFLNIVILFLSTPAQQYRYLYPNLLVFYLLVIMLVSIITKRKSNENTISSNSS